MEICIIKAAYLSQICLILASYMKQVWLNDTELELATSVYMKVHNHGEGPY